MVQARYLPDLYIILLPLFCARLVMYLFVVDGIFLYDV